VAGILNGLSINMKGSDPFTGQIVENDILLVPPAACTPR
jgi:hypothetical protein